MSKKIMSLALVLVIIFSLLGPFTSTEKVEAEALATLPVGENITDWILDEPANMIYAITASGNLKLISLDTFQVKSSISIGGTPSDIKQVGNSLFVADNNLLQVVEIDLITSAVVKTIKTSADPYKIAVNSDKTKMYYVEFDQHSDLHAYDLTNNTEHIITINGETYSSFYEPDIYIDSNQNVVYIAESANSGSVIHAISTANYSSVKQSDNTYKYYYQLLSKSTYNEELGFSYPIRNVIRDNTDIFYAGRKLELSNLENIHGTYMEDNSPNSDADLTTVSGDYVFSTQSVFDRNTYQKFATLPFETAFVLATGIDKVYLFKPTDNTIQKVAISVTGNSLPRGTPINNKLIINESLNDWVSDEANKKIYAISKDNNLLITINAETMAIEEKKPIGSMPTDIDLVNGKLYIANSGGTNISVVDLANGNTVTEITTGQNPYNVETDGKDLYYSVEDQWGSIYHKDLATNTESILGTITDDYYEADIQLDSINHVLYVGESSGTGSDLYKLNAVDGTVLEKTSTGSSSYPERSVILEDGQVFYYKNIFNTTNITTPIASLNEDVVYVNADYIFTTDSIFNRSTNQKIYTFPSPIKFANVDQLGRIYVYLQDKQAVYRFDTLGDLQNQLVKNVVGTADSYDVFKLNWDVATGDGYNVYYQNENQTSFTKLTGSLSVNNSLNLSGMQLKSFYGNTVSFGVKSMFAGRESQSMNSIQHKFEIPAPINLNGSLTNSIFTLNWDKVNYMDGYNLYYYTTTNPTPVRVNSSVISTNTYSMTEDIYKQWYGGNVTFVVSSVVNNKESIKSQGFTYTFEIPVPQNLTGAYTNAVYTLNWDKLNYMEGYNLYYYTETDTTPILLNSDVISLNTYNITEDIYKEWQGKNVTFVVRSVVNNKESDTSTGFTYAFEQLPVLEEPIPADEENPTTDPAEEPTTEEPQQQEGTPTETKDETQPISVKPTITANKAKISDSDLTNVQQNSEVVIDLGTESKAEIDVVLSPSQLETLIQKNATLSISQGGVDVQIPASNLGSADQETVINVTKLSTVRYALSEVYDFTITQGDETISRFTKAVTLTFRVDPSKVTNPELVKVFYWNPEKKAWEIIGGIYKDGVITAQTNHFSIYTVFETAATNITDTKVQPILPVGAELPKTATSNYNFMVAGFALILTGSIILVIRRKKHSTN